MKKGFVPSSYYYKFGSTYTTSQPKFTSISYFLKEDDDTYVAVCKFNVTLLSIVAFIVLILTIYTCIFNTSSEITVKCPKTMYLSNDVLSLDLQNDSEYDVTADLYVNNLLVTSTVVKAKSSKSNVQCTSELGNGNYSGNLEISYGDLVSTKDVLVVVE